MAAVLHGARARGRVLRRRLADRPARQPARGRRRRTAGRSRTTSPSSAASTGGTRTRSTSAASSCSCPRRASATRSSSRDLEGYRSDPEAALAAAATPAVVRRQPAAPTGFRGRHPYLSRFAETAAALAVVAGILYYASRPHGWDAVSTAHRARAEAVFSREAEKIAGHPARVVCDTSGRYVGFVQDADGLAFVGGARAYLTPAICDTLYQLAFKHRAQSFPRTARAIAVLAHESWHLEGVSNEGLTNCYAFQSGVRLGVDLGLSDGTAYSMMREQLATNAVRLRRRPALPRPARLPKRRRLRPEPRLEPVSMSCRKPRRTT